MLAINFIIYNEIVVIAHEVVYEMHLIKIGLIVSSERTFFIG